MQQNTSLPGHSPWASARIWWTSLPCAGTNRRKLWKWPSLLLRRYGSPVPNLARRGSERHTVEEGKAYRVRAEHRNGSDRRDFLTLASSRFPHNRSDKILRIAKQHQRFVQVIQRIFNSGKSGAHPALDDHHRAGLIHIQNGHAINRAALVFARGRVD